jgi:hypothetical protein
VQCYPTVLLRVGVSPPCLAERWLQVERSLQEAYHTSRRDSSKGISQGREPVTRIP